MSMQFTCSTKPLSDALNLGVINANVSKFNKKSCMAQVTANGNNLKINLEAASIVTELRLKGSGSGEASTAFVDNLLLKQLVASIETATVVLEFEENGLTIHSGKSKFTLPKLVDEKEAPDLSAPSMPDYTEKAHDIKKEAWKFIEDHQMFAIGMSFIRPVYTKVWMGEDSDVLVGDMDNGIFTHSKKGTLGNTCVLVDTIINLFTSLPEDAKILQIGKGYQVQAATDGFEYVSEISPEYEDDEKTGSYRSDMILDMMDHKDTQGIKVSAAAVNKLLAQAALLAPGSDDTITLSVKGDVLTLQDNNIDGKVAIEGVADTEFSVEFRSKLLKPMISNYGDESVHIAPIKQGDDVAGIVVWNDALTSVLAGVE